MPTAVKRKRPGSEGSPPSSPSTVQTSRNPSSSPTLDVPLANRVSRYSTARPWQARASSQLDSRTRKRYRDNRPNENAIHEKTYQMLFAAARSSPLSAKELAFPAAPNPIRPSPPQRQPSLHNYWTIASSPPSIAQNAERIIAFPSTSCEDCEAALPMPDLDIHMGGMDIDMPNSDFACRHCGRKVCDICAVIDVGVGRDCLQCRTSRRKWVGGIGWVP